VPESSLTDAIVGELLPAMRFQYSSLPERASSGESIPGFGALSTRLVDVPGSPPNSIDEARTELMDVNSDGLPDLVVTDPARYRTADGQPAAGVFFNGFSGTDARPATAGTFSGAVPVPMRSDLSGVMAFSNLNIVPMDVDGDGRGDLLHMPRERTYGWFTPVRRADPAGGAAFTSPRDQGWRFAYASLDLPRDDLDPRIDLTRDGQHIQVLDVNNDHLVDVVRTTGTVMQTWLNLGWLPGGDGRFGSYRITGTGRLTTSNVALSTAPYESCLLQSGLPLDFESPEARFADMNGDGLQDIVEIQRGRIRYWPGRGLGSWGTGPRMCARGEGANRYIEVTSPPRDLPIDLAGVQLADLDGDGASDIVAVRFDAIDVWFNRAGQSFTDRLILRGTPPAPGFANRVRFTDIDGSGTIDAVYGDGSGWRYVDLLSNGGVSQRPRLLVGVENGLGAATEIAYESAAVDYLRDLAEARSCGTSCESFTWHRIEGSPSQRLARLSDEPDENLYRAEGTPVLSTVVRSVRTTDRMNVFGREEQVSESHFAYHDGYYEGIEQEFRGFGAADAIVLGDSHDEPAGPYDESVLTRTWFHQGRRPANIADDRLAWSPDEALKGREYLTEVFDRQGTFLTTSHASLTTRLLHEGLDGRPIQYAFVSEMNEVRYDTSPFTPGTASLALPSVRRESASGAPTSDPPRTIALRGELHARVRTTYDQVDNLGHVLRQTVYGHYRPTPADAPGWVGETDERVTSVTEPLLLNDDGHWLWRTERQFGFGASAPSYHFGDTTTTFDDATGDPLTSTTPVSHAGVPAYEFAGDSFLEGGALTLSNAPEALVSRTWFDAWGSSTAACAGAAPTGSSAPTTPPAGCMRFGTVAYDGVYRQFPITETAFVSATATLATSVPMDTANPGWDRGLGAVRRVLDPNSEETSLTHDGLGRLTTMTPPPVGLPTGEECGRGVPTTVLSYELTTDPVRQPMSRVLTTQVLRVDGGRCGFDGLGTEPPISSAIGYVDGLGRVRATLAQAERDTPGHHWIRSGIAILDRKGQVTRAFHPSYLADVTDFTTVLSPTSGQPAAPASMRTNYDAFGRTRFLYAEDGALTTTAFHAASTTVCDPLDNLEGTHFSRTCTTSRSDGFGRVIDQILVESTEVGTADDRFDRLYSYYRADGVVLTLVRTQTTDQSVRPSSPLSVPGAFVRRDFVYDSVGRRLGSFDPDTDDPTNADTGTNTWRYRFNRVGDLVGVRDPRGCGQNFLYDLGGRLLGEQYVSCAEAVSAVTDAPSLDNTVPSGSIGEGVLGATVTVDVRYDYDVLPDWTSDLVVPTHGGTAGRATGVTDRGQRSAVAYDDRGNAIWTARQMAMMPFSAPILESDLSGDHPVLQELGSFSFSNIQYDAEPVHTYIRTSEYDHAGRGRRLTLPLDPDFEGPSLGGGPVVSGELELDPRGLPIAATAYVGEEPIRVLGSVDYDVEGQVETRSWGGTTGLLDESFDYDIRNRPIAHEAVRAPTMGAMAGAIGAVEYVAREQFGWDVGSNLVEIRDARPVEQWAEGHRPRNTYIGHDSLYRVAQVSYEYRDESGYGTDTSTDWRDDAAGPNGQDPMQPRPASMIGQSHGERIQQLDYEWDYLGNQIRWLDDAFEAESRGEMFYERGIGEITNGNSTGASAGSLRPSALYLSTNIDTTGGVDPSWNGAGWVEVEYGISGNVASFTVHGQCHDNGALECSDSTGTLTSRIGHFRANCACAEEQHYRYRWDELNRLVEGLRYDRATGGSWTYGARMRYRYDGANQRTVKQSFAATDVNTPERHALYVYAEFERRGLVIGVMNSNGPTYLATASTGDATETQYLIADARIVWDGEPSIAGTDIDRNRRVTVNASDLLDTITASIDIESGTLVEVSTYYPNGARENLWANEADVPLEPMGFTGKEADEEIGVTYFGERWLIPRLGRWATPDPLHVHAAGGEEVLNSFHYVSGNLLQATDPTGLQQRPEMCTEPNFAPPPTASERAGAVAGERAAVGEAGAAVANMYGIEPTMSAAHMTPQHLALFRAAQALGALGWVETPRGEYHYSGAAVTGYWAPRPWQGTGGEEFDRAFSTAYDNVMDSVPQDVWEATHPQQVSALETLTARLGSLLVSSAEAQPPDTATTGARGEAIARGILEDVGFRDIVAIQNDSGNGFDIVARYGRRIIVAEVKSSRRDVFRGLSELQVDFRSALRRILEQAQTDRYPAAQRAAAARLERQIAARGGRVAGIYIGVANVRSGNAIQVSIERWTRQGRAAPVIRGTRAAATVELRRHLQRARRARRR
jgi:RHS repeat-associated protein